MPAPVPLIFLDTNLAAAFLLEQDANVLSLLDSARRKAVEVRVPELCLAESRGMIRRRLKKFRAQLDGLGNFIRDAERIDIVLN